MIMDTDASGIEFDAQSNNEVSLNYVQELINHSDLLMTNEEMDLFPDIQVNSIRDYNENESNKPVLITEVGLEMKPFNPVSPFLNDKLGTVIEENDAFSQISEAVEQTIILNQDVSENEKSEHSEHSEHDLIEDNEHSNDGSQSLFSRDELWDTDLEEDFATSKDRSSTSTYIDLCTKYEVVPVKFYLQNMHKSNLSIKHHGLGPHGTKALAKSLESNIAVDTLDLSGNWIYPAGALAIWKMLEENNFITKLVLSDNLIGDQGLTGLNNAMQINRGLRHLDLSGNNITDHGCIELSELISKSRYLTELTVSRNNIASRGAHLLASSIASNDILEMLDLSWNKINGSGAVDLAKGLKENIRIKHCDLSYNGFAKDGGRALADTIRDNTALTFLNIESNRFDGETAASIGKALTANDTLEELRMGYNTIDTNGILSLLSSINSYESSPLKTLYLTDIPVDYEITKVVQRIQSKRPEFSCIHGLELGVGNTPDDIKKRLINIKNPIILLKEHILIKDKRLIDILMRLDVDKNNYVTVNQFAQALEELGVPFKVSQLQEIQSRLDKIGNGTIFYGDFVPVHQEVKEDNFEEKPDI